MRHGRAYAEGARYYKLEVDGVEPRQSFTDYRWSTSTNRFQAQAVNPTATGYYRVRAPSELWYHHWLGYLLNTSGLTNGLHVITIRLFAPKRVRNIFICAGVVFCASSRITNASASVRPRMKAIGAISISPLAIRRSTCSAGRQS